MGVLDWARGVVSRENRELAEVGRDTLSGSDWFWVQFFLIGIGLGVAPLAADYYLHYRLFGVDGLVWFAGAWFLAGIWAGGQKFWDDQKRNSPRWSSPGFEGTVRLQAGSIRIGAVMQNGVVVYPPLRVVPEGVDHLVHWTPWRGTKVIEREDGVFSFNGKHHVSNTASKQMIWDALPGHVRDAIRTHRRTAKVKFVRGDWRYGRPILGTKFVYGYQPVFGTFCDHPFDLDSTAGAQTEVESMRASAGERMGAYALGTVQTTAKAMTGHIAKKARTVNPLDEAEEDEERGGSFQ